jgi:hypothetical protein
MSTREDVKDNDRDPLDPSAIVPSEIPAGLDRRKFIMRGAVISAAAVMNGCTRSETEKPPLRPHPHPNRHAYKDSHRGPLSRCLPT